MVRALFPHQYSHCQIPASTPYVVEYLSLLLVLSLVPRGFSPGTPFFRSPQKPTFSNFNSARNRVDEEPLSGCATSKSLLIYLFIIEVSDNAR